MNDRLKKSIEFSKYRQTLNNQISLLKTKTNTLLHYSVAGGTFLIRPELMSLVDRLIQRGQVESVLLDMNNTPIKIENLKDFLEEIDDRYFNVLNEYYKEFEKLRQARSVQSILDLNDD